MRWVALWGGFQEVTSTVPSFDNLEQSRSQSNMKVFQLLLLLLVVWCACTVSINLPRMSPHATGISNAFTAPRILPGVLPLSSNTPVSSETWDDINPALNWGNGSAGSRDVVARNTDEGGDGWCRAVSRGRAFLKAQMLESDEARRELGWAYLQSPWDGSLHEELRQWGYVEETADAYCDFNDLHDAFTALGVDPNPASKQGPNHCFRFRHSDGPAMRRVDGQLPPKREQTYVVDGIEYPVSLGCFDVCFCVLISGALGYRCGVQDGCQSYQRPDLLPRPQEPRDGIQGDAQPRA